VGAGAAIIVSAGFAGAGEPVGRGLLELARAHSVRVVGPDSQGVLSRHAAFNASFARELPPVGGLAVAAQSGGVGFTVLDLARAQGVGVHSFVSLGAKLDVSSNDLLAAWGDDERVTVAALYLESFGNALKFARTARRFASRKPLLAVAGGSAATEGVTALFAQAGVIPCRGAADIAEAAAVLTQQPLPSGFRVGVVTNAGGMGLLTAGMASGEGLSVPALSPSLVSALSSAVPVVSAANPVDLGADVSPASLSSALGLLLASSEVDAAVVTLVPTVLADPVELRAAVASAALEAGKPVVVVASDVRSDESLPGLTAYRTPLVAVVALARAMRYAAWRRVSADEAPPVDAARAAAARSFASQRLAGRSGEPEWLPDSAAATLLAGYGVQPVGFSAVGPMSAASGASSLGWPVVVKVADPAVRHRTDRGLVRVGLTTPDAVADAVTAFAAANIAGSDMFTTGIEAFRLGIAGFFVPFAFVYHQELLLKGGWPEIFLMSGFAAVSAIALASCVVGHGGGPLPVALRAACVVAAGMMVMRSAPAQVLGLVLYAGILYLSARQARQAVAVSSS
jgi:acyl-CoA synthetase (NDP forming)